jgi:hypothetical protein
MKKILLLATLLATSQWAAADSTIYKCKANGKTTYSETPCGINTTKRMEIDTTERMGNVTYDRDTIESARARIREGMDQHGTGASTGATGSTTTTTTTTVTTRTAGGRKTVCDSVKADLANIDAQSRIAQSGYSQDALRQRKIQVQKKAIEWKC